MSRHNNNNPDKYYWMRKSVPKGDFPGNGVSLPKKSPKSSQPHKMQKHKKTIKHRAKTSVITNPSKVSKTLHNACNEIKENDKPCLNKIGSTWSKTKPLAGKKVLVNIHMTLITLDMIRIIHEAGAFVETTTSRELSAHENAVSALQAAEIPYYANGEIPEEKRKNYYDIVFDCGAGMFDKVTPKLGMVELTHTDPAIYKKISFPVITVDNSKTKEIETAFGTGDGALRTLNQLAMQCIAHMAKVQYLSFEKNPNVEFSQSMWRTILAMQDIRQLFNKKFMLFGYGKVGKGIASALISAKVKKNNICIVEISSNAVMQIRKDGFEAFSLNHELNKIKQQLTNNVYAVIMATGVKGALSKYFAENDFKKVFWLMNMGTPDEIGDLLLQSELLKGKIVNKGKTANFMLAYPTEIIYLDPIFSLCLAASLQLLNNSLESKLHNVSNDTDEQILSDWNSYHGNKVWKHTLGQKKVTQFLKELQQASFLGLNDVLKKFGLFDEPAGTSPRYSLPDQPERNNFGCQ